MFAMIGPAVQDGVILSGHTDVVPIDGQQWDTDPWTLTERDGRLYGRGTCDMKGFVAVILSKVPMMKAAGLRRPVILALSRDEEIGCIGAPPMIRKMVAELPPVSSVIVGEPSMMRVVTGHKGGQMVLVSVRGHEVHSSIMHRGVSAVMQAARLVEWVRKDNLANELVAAGKEGNGFDPPYTTQHVGRISGGTAQNITAGECSFCFEVRCVPGESAADYFGRFAEFARSVELEMQAVEPGCSITLSPGFEIPPLRPETNGRAEEIVRRITGDNGVHMVSYATEAGQFQEAYGSSVICGPGDIAQAHGANEFVAIDQIRACEDFVDRLIGELSA